MLEEVQARKPAADDAAVLGQILGRLDRLPWARFHTKITLALGFGWVLDAFEITIIGSIIAKNSSLDYLLGRAGKRVV